MLITWRRIAFNADPIHKIDSCLPWNLAVWNSAEAQGTAKG